MWFFQAPEAVEYCLFAGQWWWLCMAKSEWAAWVQAVGSVIAICVAVALSWHQVWSSRRLEAERMVRRIAALRELCLYAYRLIKDVLENSHEPGNALYYYGELYPGSTIKDTLTEMSQVRAVEYESPDVVAGFLALRDTLTRTSYFAKSMSSYGHNDIEHHDWDEIRAYARELQTKADAAAIKLGLDTSTPKKD